MSAGQKHNASFHAKQIERLRHTRHLPDSAWVLDAFAGEGRIYRGCWARFRGICIDNVASKASSAARERPRWACYEADTEKALRMGLGAARPFDIVDLDCYGAPWPFVRAWLTSDRVFADRTHVFLTDGYMRQRNLSTASRDLFPEMAGRNERINITEGMYTERVSQRLGDWATEAGLRIENLQTRNAGAKTVGKSRHQGVWMHYFEAVAASENSAR